MASKEDTQELFLSYEEIRRLLYSFKLIETIFGNLKEAYNHLGITCTSMDDYWWNAFKNESNLKVVDEKKFLLAKIKYGI